MHKIVIKGGNKLNGKLNVPRSKNAALPILCVSLLTEDKITFHDVPKLGDIETMLSLLGKTNMEITQAGSSYTLQSHAVINPRATYDMVRTMRAGVLVLGPMLARVRMAYISLPGGCSIGARPVDIHLKALEAMGANIEVENGYIKASALSGLHGADISFPVASVGATENIIMAASCADGTTIIRNAAREPEIVHLADCLNRMGANINNAGESVIEVVGVKSLHGIDFNMPPDRIQAGTYLLAVAATGGEIETVGIEPQELSSLIDVLKQAGCKVETTKNSIKLKSDTKLQPVDITTAPYPGYPTDLQAQFLAAMTQADGSSIIRENMFENRLMHVPELRRMGADITTDNNCAIVKGRSALNGAQVMATDLRASASLVICGLVASGETVVNRVYHLDRGYENIEENLRALGANISRVD